jgi:hypothetical protein
MLDLLKNIMIYLTMGMDRGKDVRDASCNLVEDRGEQRRPCGSCHDQGYKRNKFVILKVSVDIKDKVEKNGWGKEM